MIRKIITRSSLEISFLNGEGNKGSFPSPTPGGATVSQSKYSIQSENIRIGRCGKSADKDQDLLDCSGCVQVCEQGRVPKASGLPGNGALVPGM